MIPPRPVPLLLPPSGSSSFFPPGARSLSLEPPPRPTLHGEPSTCSFVPGACIWVSPPASPCPDHPFTFAAALLTPPPRTCMARQGPPLDLETRRRGSGVGTSEGQWFVAQVAA